MATHDGLQGDRFCPTGLNSAALTGGIAAVFEILQELG